MPALRGQARQELPALQQLRRNLHREPELGLNLPSTQRKVLDALEGLPLEVSTGTALTSVTAVLRGAHPGPVVLLRGDMDALPISEDTGLSYAAENGCMHACGHDLHTAGLVGAAKLLSQYRQEIHGSVIFMFQPGEEGHGGAGLMIKEGVLEAAGEAPSAAFSLHVMPGPRGVFDYRPGPLLAGASELFITVQGRGGHGSQPQNAVDPVPALISIASTIQSLVTSKHPTFDPVVLTITELEGGQAINVIPDSARLAATVRTMAPESVDSLRAMITDLARGIASGFGCTADVDLRVNFPATVNDDEATRWAAEVLTREFGDERVQLRPEPIMASEDFSMVLERIPGAMLFLAASPPGLDPEETAWNHSPEVQFDDEVLADQAVALAALALQKLTDPT